MRIGIGYDVHKLVKGQSIILGGVKIPSKKTLIGHSDADVLTHAIMDSLLGAAGLRDIGYQFPENDVKYKKISSLFLLKEVDRMVKNKGLQIVNIDATVLAEEPKLSPYIDEMRSQISKALLIDPEQIMIKATTNEGLGFVGNKKGIAVFAITSLTK